jgi:hypothetical protein
MATMRKQAFDLYCKSRNGEIESSIAEFDSLINDANNSGEGDSVDALVAKGYLACALFDCHPTPHSESDAKQIFSDIFSSLCEVCDVEECCHVYMILGQCYFDGLGVPVDHVKARVLL